MHYDAIIIGAGMSGVYQLYALKRLGMSVRLLEAGSDVGGTWHWNRYPGARFDSESYTYGYSFSKELLDQWHWSELFAGQPEVRRYIKGVVDKFDLSKDIDFNTRVTAAHYDESANLWIVEAEGGRKVSCRYLISAVGPLSIPIMPRIPGIETFKGVSFHSFYWPDDLDIKGKKVAVIGTGATGIQIIQSIAPIVGQLTVYQRGGNWAKPLCNRPIDQAEMDRIRSSYPDVFARCKSTTAGFIHDKTPVNTFDVSEEERQRFYGQKYAEPGFAYLMSNYQDMLVDDRATQAAQDFLAAKIRERVKDPKVAEILIPKDHPFGAKRMPMETNYYEAYNRDNVKLIDLYATPIESVTPDGIITGGIEGQFDIIVVYATGFDAFRGGLDRIDFRGVGGQRLIDKWADGLATYMGFQMHGFPNLLTILGPLSGGTVCNFPRCIEQNVEFITDLLAYMKQRGFNRIEASAEAERAWTQEANDLAANSSVMKYDTYATSSNSQAPGPKKRQILLHFAGQNVFRQTCADVVADGYRGFVLSRHSEDAYAKA